MKDKSDIELLRAIAQQNHEALAELYQRHAQKVYNTALNLTQNVEDAEEVTQDVFVRVYKKAHQYEQRSQVSTWIYRITVNHSLNQIKKSKRHPNPSELAAEAAVDFVHPGVRLQQKENAQMLYRCVEQLPSRQKAAFVLSYIQGLPRQQVADIMQTSLKSVESLLQRAKQNLRTILKKFQD